MVSPLYVGKSEQVKVSNVMYNILQIDLNFGTFNCAEIHIKKAVMSLAIPTLLEVFMKISFKNGHICISLLIDVVIKLSSTSIEILNNLINFINDIRVDTFAYLTSMQPR